MAALVEQKEAARLLGISEEELKSLISKNEIFGYRDGPNWKFKMEELERVADERGVQLGAETPQVGGSGIDTDLESLSPVDDVLEEGGGESILGSEEELGASGVGTASTIIGKEDLDSDESDVKIADEAGDDNAAEASDVLMSTAGDDLLGDSQAGTEVIDDAPVAESGSATGIGLDDDALDVELEVGSQGSDAGSGPDLELDDSLAIDSELEAGDSLSLDDDWDDESPTQLGATAGDSGNLDVDSGEDDDLVLASSIALDDDDDESALALGEDENIDLGSGVGSDVTLGSGDSGIGLSNPTDSGLSLEEEPVELGGSQVGAMALGEDDMIELEEEGDPDAATQLKADDDFLLTPVDDDADEESDSGSQVIALDTEQFDENAETMLSTGPAVLEEDDFGAAPAAGMAPAGGVMSQPMMQQAQVPEAKYSIWNVLSLMLVFALMTLTGMLMIDVVQTMWQYDEPVAANSTVMDFVLSLIKR